MGVLANTGLVRIIFKHAVIYLFFVLMTMVFLKYFTIKTPVKDRDFDGDGVI